MNTEKPADFDWVSERRKCSIFSAFKELERLAKRDVEHRSSLLTEKEHQVVTFLLKSEGNQYFTVIADNLGRLVSFFLNGSQIEIAGDGVIDPMVVTLTLNQNGDCRLRVNGQGEFQPWQVLRLALEDLLFDLRTKEKRRG